MGQGRVELPTSRLSGVRSNHLSYWPVLRHEDVGAMGSTGPSPDRVCEHVGARSLETESYAVLRTEGAMTLVAFRTCDASEDASAFWKSSLERR